jgi:hypothetical protein
MIPAAAAAIFHDQFDMIGLARNAPRSTFLSGIVCAAYDRDHTQASDVGAGRQERELAEFSVD